MKALRKRLSFSYSSISKVGRIILRIIKSRFLLFIAANSKTDIVNLHFQFWAPKNHVNRKGFEIALNLATKERPIIFETGTSAYGIDSTRLLDQYAFRYGGKLMSVDLSPRPKHSLKFQLSSKTELFVMDSLLFINNELETYTHKIDICYLDSWDVDWESPSASEQHGLSEFLGISKFLVKGSIIVIDDTPSELSYVPEVYQNDAAQFKKLYGRLPGKGSLVLQEIISGKSKELEIIHHEYNLVLLKK